MARTTHAAAATVQPRRPEDRRGYYVASWWNSLAWPSVGLGSLMILIFSAIFVVRGRQAAAEWLEDITAPAFLVGLGTVVVGIVTLVFKVSQIAKAEMHAAAAASSSAAAASNSAGAKEEAAHTREETKQLVAEVLAAVKAQPAGGDRVDPTPSEVLRIVMGLQKTVGEIQANAAAAAQNSSSALETVVGYGGSLQAIASSTGQLKARTDAAGDAARDSLRATQPSSSGEPFPAPPPGQPTPSADPLDTSRPWYRDPTSQQPVVPAADEQEDWRPGDDRDDGPGLPTGYRMDFRAAMEAADREAANPFLDERLLRGQAPEPAQQPTAPTPRFPRPDADERARQADARRQMRDRQPRWDNPEEGPR